MLSSRPAAQPASRERGILGFDSLPALLAFGFLLLLLFCSPAQLSGFWPATYDFWPQTLFLLLGAGGALILAISPLPRPRLDATACLLLGFLGWSALAVSTTVYRHDSWLELARVGGGLTTFFAVRVLWSRERALWIVSAWVLGMTWICFSPIRQFFQDHVTGLAGYFYNQNLLANALSMTLPVALMVPILVRRANRNPPVVALAALPFLICALGLLLTASKGGFLSGLIALLVTALMVLRAKASVVKTAVKSNRTAFAAGALVFLVLFGLIAAKTVVPRLQKARGAEDNSTMFRAYIWRSAVSMIKARPLTGFGPGSFPHTYPQYAQVGYTRSAHESWLQVAAENGLPALVLLMGALGVALVAGAKKLKTGDWPLIAGMSGAVVALLTHGCVDSGFQTTSIVILLGIALAVLTADETPLEPTASRLNPFWLGATLLLALGGNMSQKAAGGEEVRDEAAQLLRNGSVTMAINKEQDATAIDPGSARLWLDLGIWQEGGSLNGHDALLTAGELQPTNAVNWTNLARNAQRLGDLTGASKYYELAEENDPIGTHTLLECAGFWIKVKDKRGLETLGKIISLWDGPYGKYAPVEQIVNLDFARATILWAPELKREGKGAQLKALVQHGIADCNRARGFVAQNEAMREASGGVMAGDDNEDLETLATQLQQLQTGLK